MMPPRWHKISCLRDELQLRTTLTGGQSFRWKRYEPAEGSENGVEQFIGVFANVVWILTQSVSELRYRVVGELPYPNGDRARDVNASRSEGENLARVRLKVAEPDRHSTADSDLLYPATYYDDLLRVYLRLDVDLARCYRDWTASHAHFESNASQFYAVRQLNQDPVENLFSFICSQNNNISRISGLVEKICTHYGTKICEFGGVSYFNFPPVAALAEPTVEGHLRQLGFGYRARYIQKSAEEIHDRGGLHWFRKLQALDYKDAHSELLTLTGIGPKVADCICLMSLDHLQAIPVDTHVYQIARHYLPHLGKAKTVTPKLYAEIGDKFREVYGTYAGWAQTVLFCADLRQFKENGGPKRTSDARIEVANVRKAKRQT